MPWDSRFNWHRQFNLMHKIAEKITVTPAALCPCTLETNQADILHALCRGSGHIPLLAQRYVARAVVSRFSARWVQGEVGPTEPGDILISPLPRDTHILGQWDTVQLGAWEHGEPFEGERITVPEFNTAGQRANVNFLTYAPKAIEQIFSVDGNAVLPYVANVDYALVGHEITWLNQSIPPGTIVSVKYRAIQEYVVVEVPDVRYERGTDLGRRVLARKRHLMQLGQTLGTPFSGSMF